MKMSKCRICGGTHFEEIINLGYQKLTGVFPQKGAEIEGGELNLVKCTEEGGCGLVQLDSSFESSLMYGDNYGYRSSLNKSMVEHLTDVVAYAVGKMELDTDDLVVDIGSNDGTLLGLYSNKCDKKLIRVGIDPTGEKFHKYYDKEVKLVPDFFSAEKIKSVCDKKAKVVTSIAMFYDLEDPIEFVKNIYEILDDDGIWITEQSYCPLMVDACSYDTICHEHIEYYTLKQFRWITERAGMRIVDVELNDINGGSFRLTMCKESAKYAATEAVERLEKDEEVRGVNDLSYMNDFVERINNSKTELIEFLQEKKAAGELVLGYGASTKGNVVLQYCGIDSELLPAIVEVNQDKLGCVTPGTGINIISEQEGRDMNPAYMLVLPWHFKNNILEKEREYMQKSGCKFVFALPEFEIVSCGNE